MLLHDGGLISPAPIPNFLCLCFDLRVFAHGEIDKEESMVATFPSSTPGEKSTFFTFRLREHYLGGLHELLGNHMPRLAQAVLVHCAYL